VIVHVIDLPCLCFWLMLTVSLNVSSPANATDHGTKDVAGLHTTSFWFTLKVISSLDFQR
jgi:hypothetical protein